VLKMGTSPEKVLIFDHKGPEKITWSGTSVAMLKLGRYEANHATNYMYNLVLQFVFM